MKRICFVLLTTIFILSCLNSREQIAGPPKINAISVSTLNGEVVDVKVPNDIRPGDHITGSVILKTRSSTLEGTVIEIDGKQTGLKGKMFSFVVPAGLAAIPFLIKDKNGKTIGTTNMQVTTPGVSQPGGSAGTIPPTQVATTPPHAPGNFVPMNYCQPGQPLTINGAFDGNAENTSISINNIPCEVIAESPRGCFVQVPLELQAGPATINIVEGEVVQAKPIQVVTINLTADKTVVHRGESARVTCTVKGLENLDLNNNNFNVGLTNGTPGVIQFRGANTISLTRDINSSNTTNGSFSFTTDINGIAAGSYTITSNINSTTGISCWEKYKNCLANCEAQEKKCYEDCDKGNKGFGCYLACSAAARLCEAAYFTEYLKCLEEALSK